jgi:hypothetical protein
MKIAPALRRLLIAVRGRTETYGKPAALPMHGLRGLAMAFEFEAMPRGRTTIR